MEKSTYSRYPKFTMNKKLDEEGWFFFLLLFF